MKLLLFLLLTKLLFTKPNCEKIFDKTYSELSLKPRIENCGIYLFSGFDVSDGKVYLKHFDLNKTEVFDFAGEKTGLYSSSAYDCIAGNHNFTNSTEYLQNPLRKIYLSERNNIFFDNNNKLSNNYESIFYKKISNSLLEIKIDLENFKNQISLKFDNDLACFQVIGIDKYGNIFIIIEKYLSQIPLKVKRCLYVINKSSEILSVLEIPYQKYITIFNEFKIDEDGNFYHLCSNENKIFVLKWSGIARFNLKALSYPDGYCHNIHFNDYVKNDEFLTNVNNNIKAISYRSTALRIGETYVLHKYNISSGNMATKKIKAADGDTVQTPDWLIVGQNSRVPYKWGGFDKLTTFNSGLLANKYAGDIHTAGVSSYSVGVDCSGFVSRCWQLTSHYATSSMPGITTQYTSWDQLKPGDAIHKVGHVRLFVKFNNNGTLRVVESAGRNWDVSYWSFTLSDLQSYTPRYLNTMSPDYSEKWLTLLRCRNTSSGKIELNWYVSDSTNIKGYRIYESSDGISWNMLFDENIVKNINFSFSPNPGKYFYKVSAVSDNTPYFTESFWSNSMAVNFSQNKQKILIVDGFNRQNGSWQGPSNDFALKYSRIFTLENRTVESIKSTEVSSLLSEINSISSIFWFTGDESLADTTLSSAEQIFVKKYLESGGNLFLSGSEIGYDLYYLGDLYDKEFYLNYLKSQYSSDNSYSKTVKCNKNEIFDSLSFNIGQVYYEDSPDVITTYNGSIPCLYYDNNLIAAIYYTGKFGASEKTGRLVYLPFALETTANDTAFYNILRQSYNYFMSNTTIANETINNYKDLLFPNYPNPFNPSTTIRYELSKRGYVNLSVFNVLGEQIANLVNTIQDKGVKEVKWSGVNFSSGIYYYKLSVYENETNTLKYLQMRKMLLIK